MKMTGNHSFYHWTLVGIQCSCIQIATPRQVEHGRTVIYHFSIRMLLFGIFFGGYHAFLHPIRHPPRAFVAPDISASLIPLRLGKQMGQSFMAHWAFIDFRQFHAWWCTNIYIYIKTNRYDDILYYILYVILYDISYGIIWWYTMIYDYILYKPQCDPLNHPTDSLCEAARIFLGSHTIWVA